MPSRSTIFLFFKSEVLISPSRRPLENQPTYYFTNSVILVQLYLLNPSALPFREGIYSYYVYCVYGRRPVVYLNGSFTRLDSDGSGVLLHSHYHEAHWRLTTSAVATLTFDSALLYNRIHH